LQQAWSAVVELWRIFCDYGVETYCTCRPNTQLSNITFARSQYIGLVELSTTFYSWVTNVHRTD